jgi:hypothetical protein
MRLDMDEFIATKVMEWHKKQHCGFGPYWFTEDGLVRESVEEFLPSEDWRHAGMVVDILTAEYQYLHFRLYSRDNGYEANFIHNVDGASRFYIGYGTEAPEAICIAAERLVSEGER